MPSTVEAAVPTFAPRLAGLRANVVETHQVISSSGLNDLVLPCLRSTSRPLVASADSRLFQAVGPIEVGEASGEFRGGDGAGSSAHRMLSAERGRVRRSAGTLMTRRPSRARSTQHVTAGAHEEFELFGEVGARLATAG